jgi:hypothetical protein
VLCPHLFVSRCADVQIASKSKGKGKGKGHLNEPTQAVAGKYDAQ